MRAQNPNGTSICSAVVQMTAESPYTLQRFDRYPIKITPSQGGCGTHLIHGSLGPPDASSQMAIGLHQPFAGLTSVTDRQTTLHSTAA